MDSTPLQNNEVYSLAPGEGKIPVFKEPHAEYLCFCTIFCGQQQPPNSEHKWKVHTSDIFKSELCHVDTHVSLNIPNIFWKAKYLQIQQITNKVTLALCHVVGPKKRKVTAHSLCNKNLQEEICHLDKGYAIFHTIWNIPPYFKAKMKEVLSMLPELGIPTIFFSISSADTNRLPLLKCLGLLEDKEVYSDEYITNEMSLTKNANWLQHILQYAVDTSTIMLRNT